MKNLTMLAIVLLILSPLSFAELRYWIMNNFDNLTVTGLNGADGLNLTMDHIDDNGDGTYTWFFSDLTNFTTANLTGAKGDKGDQGLPGLDGTNGVDGTNGTNGVDGINGTNGLNGADGSNANVSCGDDYLTCDYADPLYANLTANLTTFDLRYLQIEVDPDWAANDSTVARIGACAANEFGIENTNVGLTCAQPSTDNLSEGSNLFYTDARARAAISNTAPLTYNSTSGVFGITKANDSTDGYLSYTDWGIFNGKLSTAVTSIATTAPITGGTITTTGTIGIQVANSTQDGYLTSADWTTFNGKAATGTCAGQFIQNISSSGITCASPASSYTINVSTYTSTGANTWTKPASGTVVRIQLWGGGGSGGRGGLADAGGGGGGGGYLEVTLPFASFANSETCTVGAGGASCGADECTGSAGSITTMTVNGNTYTVYGGGGGFGATSADGGGGGGGGVWGVGQVGISNAGGVGGIGCGALGVGAAVGAWGDKCGGGGGTTLGGNADWGGAGGGYGQDNGVAYGGGNSIYGGGGGAGGDGAGAPEGVPGTSIYGGNGGAGATASDAAGAGVQPAGGGGGSEQGASGKGGDGKCIITVW